MGKLILLYWGAVFLMYLSKCCFPESSRRRLGRTNILFDRVDIFMLVAIFWMAAMSFLRTAYNDTFNYISTFASSETVREYVDGGGLRDWTGNPLYNIYRNFIREQTDDYHVFFMFPAIINSIAVVKLYKRYSMDPPFSIMVFFSIGTYVMYIAALKQCIAVSILIFALPYAIDKKIIKFYLLVLIASLFHTHAFIFVVVPFLFRKPWGKVTWAGLGVALFIIATYDLTMGAFMEFALSIGVNVADIEVFDGNPIHPLRVAVYAIPAILALVFRERLFRDSGRIENLFANMSIVTAIILSIGLRQGANLFARMAAYYEIAMGITLPWMIRKLFNKQSARLITVLAYGLYFGYFLYEFGIAKNFGINYRAITLWQFIQSLFG